MHVYTYANKVGADHINIYIIYILMYIHIQHIQHISCKICKHRSFVAAETETLSLSVSVPDLAASGALS